MFAERLDRIISGLEANNSLIADHTGLDRTTVSRLRNGKRIPKIGGTVVYKLVDGLVKYAVKNGKSELLCNLTGLSLDLGQRELKDGLVKWLSIEDYERKTISSVDSQKENREQSFGERFDISMKLAKVSNISLSRRVNVDASLISRYRSGARSPRENSEILLRIGDTLWDNIRKNDALTSLAKIIGVSGPKITKDCYLKWLFEILEYSNRDIHAAQKLLYIIDSYPVGGLDVKGMNGASGMGDLSGISFEKKESYHGLKGLREAVIRFLVTAVQNGAESLWLYSDQNMEWMLQDPEFMLKWKLLMAACVKKGILIRIIHNIDRNGEELMEAVGLWMPLYMSGCIEPYFCTKSRDARFSHTLFLSPGMFCIESFNVSGLEDEGIYHFYEDEETAESKTGKKWLTYKSKSKPVLVKNKKNYVYVKVTDAAGNTGYISSMALICDTEAPVIKNAKMTPSYNKVEATVSADDTLSGVAEYYAKVRGADDSAPDVDTVKNEGQKSENGKFTFDSLDRRRYSNRR